MGPGWVVDYNTILYLHVRDDLYQHWLRLPYEHCCHMTLALGVCTLVLQCMVVANVLDVP